MHNKPKDSNRNSHSNRNRSSHRKNKQNNHSVIRCVRLRQLGTRNHTWAGTIWEEPELPNWTNFARRYLGEVPTWTILASIR
jgi:hypothetical protein